jgi:hypothetical protein
VVDYPNSTKAKKYATHTHTPHTHTRTYTRRHTQLTVFLDTY